MRQSSRLSLFSLGLCVLIGFLLGLLCPTPWGQSEDVGLAAMTSGGISALPPASEISSSAVSPSGSTPKQLDPTDNFSLLNTACLANRALKQKDYAALAALVHPTKGVTFTPYSTVNFETNLTFTADQIRTLAKDKTVYTWGTVDGRGTLIELTMSQYMDQYVFHTDYTQATEIGIDRIIVSGNALENLTEAYPGCRFVDFAFPPTDSGGQGMDWCSLKLVFEAGESSWQLVGILHGQWTA